jgi:hypothetical protein
MSRVDVVGKGAFQRNRYENINLLTDFQYRGLKEVSHRSVNHEQPPVAALSFLPGERPFSRLLKEVLLEIETVIEAQGDRMTPYMNLTHSTCFGWTVKNAKYKGPSKKSVLAFSPVAAMMPIQTFRCDLFN